MTANVLTFPSLAPAADSGMRRIAMQLARQGFRVFPLRRQRKLPAIKGWKDWATADPFKVLNDWPGDAPVGIATGADFTVIDIEAAGLATDLPALNLPPTLVVKTARGGEHHYFRTPAGQAFANSVKKLGANADTRGQGGLVVAPGMTWADPKTGAVGTYELKHDRPIAELPAHIIEKLKAAPRKAHNAGQVLVDLDNSEAFKLARAYLADAGPRGPGRNVLQGGRGYATYKAAARLGDFGISVEAAYDLLLPWNETGCTPPQDEDEFARNIENAYQFRQDPIGRDNPLRHFGEVTPPPVAPVLDPKDPMPSARELIARQYTVAEHRALHHSRGDFLKWANTHYARSEESAISADVWHFLERAMRVVSKNGDRGPFSLQPRARMTSSTRCAPRRTLTACPHSRLGFPAAAPTKRRRASTCPVRMD